MKKIAIIVSSIILLLAGGVFFLIANQSGTKLSVPKETPTPEEVQDSEANIAPLEEKKADEEESESKFVTIITEAVQSTIDFFTNKETRIVAMGDSLTQGIGDSKDQGGYVGILDRTINDSSQLVTIDNYGKRGDRTDQLLDRMDIPAISVSLSEADIVIITIGANDIMQVVKENFTNLTYNKFAKERIDYEKRLHAIFDKINDLNGNTKIYLLGFYNPFEKYFPEIAELGIIVDDWNQTGIKVTEEYDNVTYIPTSDLFDDQDVELFAEDNFHPNDVGYQRMAKRVLEYLTEKER